MGIMILVLLAAGVGYAGLCTLQGLTPTSQQLSSFEPELVAITRRFEQPPFDVWSAYAQAVRRTPGTAAGGQIFYKIIAAPAAGFSGLSKPPCGGRYAARREWPPNRP